MRIRTLATVAIASTVALGLGQTATAAPSGETVPWSAEHGTATASGERWTETEPGQIFPDLHVSGELTNTSSECYSVWFQWTRDVSPPGPAQKHVTLCGPGTVEIDYVLNFYSLTTTGRLTVCKGEDDAKDCGEWESLTRWPINN